MERDHSVMYIKEFDISINVEAHFVLFYFIKYDG